MTKSFFLELNTCNKNIALSYIFYLWLVIPYFLFIFNYYKSYVIVLTILALAIMIYDSFFCISFSRGAFKNQYSIAEEGIPFFIRKTKKLNKDIE